MSKLLISTQVYENYGNADQPYWKAKAGNDYVVLDVDVSDMVEVIVDRVRDQVEVSHDFFTETIRGYKVVADDYLTQFERHQLEFEGRITDPVTVLERPDA